jgi:hypothetical protein
LAQQHELQQQRQQLDDERRGIASQRLRESLLAPILVNLGWLAVCSLPLVLCWYLLHGLGRDSAETPVTQLLIDHLMLVDDPLRLPSQGSARLADSNLDEPGQSLPSATESRCISTIR